MPLILIFTTLLNSNLTYLIQNYRFNTYMYYLSATDVLLYLTASPRILLFIFKVLSTNQYYKYGGLAWALKYTKFSYLVLLPRLRDILLFKQRKYVLSVSFKLLSETYFAVKGIMVPIRALSKVNPNNSLYSLRHYKILLKKLPLFSFLLYVLSLFTMYPILVYTWNPLNIRIYFYNSGIAYFYDSFVMRFLLT